MKQLQEKFIFTNLTKDYSDYKIVVEL